MVKTSKQAIFNTIGLIAYLFADWLILMSIPKLYGYECAGNYSYAYSISSIVFSLACFSIRQYQVIDVYKEIKQSSYYSIQLISCSICLVSFLILLLSKSKSVQQPWCMFFLVMFQLIAAFCSTMLGDLQIKDRLDLVGICGLVTAVGKIIAFFSLSYLTHDYLLSMLGYFLTSSVLYLTSCYLSYYYVYRTFPNYFSLCTKSEIKCIFKKCIPLLCGALAPTILNAYPKIIIEHNMSESMGGYYSTLTAVSLVVPSVLSCMFQPLINQFRILFENGKIKQFSRLFWGIMIIVCTFFFISLFAGQKVIFLFYKKIYGTNILLYLDVFYISMVSMLILSFIYYATPIAILLEKNSCVFYGSLAAVTISIVCGEFLDDTKIDLTTCAYIQVVSYLVFFLILISSIIIQFQKKTRTNVDV